MLFNKDGKVFVGKRIDQTVEGWQMPQGGIDEGEAPREAALRELKEEAGTDKAKIIAEMDDWLTYDLPAVDNIQTSTFQSTKIYDRATGQVLQGRVPAGSVVVSGSMPSADGKYSLYCAVIVKRVDAQTRNKTSINELLRTD